MNTRATLLPTEPHLKWMQRALSQAQHALLLTSPNPRVGCVIVGPEGSLLGEGHTQKAGSAHAEVSALNAVKAKGLSARGATVYVTLEPCSHTGRTPPCCDALIEAQVAEVYVSVLDPNPLVSGQGLARLKASGIGVHVGLLAKEAQELNIGFFKRMTEHRPWFWSKIASSLDGQTALENGMSQWITSAEARLDGHHWRARSCAILTGIGTLLQDQPRLDVRDLETPRQPKLVVVDSQLLLALNAPALDAHREVIVYCALGIEPHTQVIRHWPEPSEGVLKTSPHRDEAARREATQEKLHALTERGVRVVGSPSPNPSPRPNDPRGPDAWARKVDLAFMARDLAKREINEVHVEAGARLNGAMLEAQLIDELLIYMAPKWLGPGRPMSVMPALNDLHQALELEWQTVDRLGVDLRIRARIKREL